MTVTSRRERSIRARERDQTLEAPRPQKGLNPLRPWRFQDYPQMPLTRTQKSITLPTLNGAA